MEANATDGTTPPGEEGLSYLVTGLAVGIPCGLIIVVLLILIVAMICVTYCNAREQENLEATYMRRRFQGLSLEEQRRRRQKSVRGKNKFVRRRSSASESRPSTIQLTSNGRIIRANPFGLQDWQLKLSGIDITTNGDTEETDVDDSDSPRSPVGAMNPLMLQQPPPDETEVSYKPVRKPRSQKAAGSKPPPRHTSRSDHTHSTPPPHPEAAAADSDDDGDSSDSFNPYD